MKFRTEQLEDMERLVGRDDVYVAPEGDRGWAILKAEDEESLRQAFLEGQEAEEVQPVLPVREYVIILGAREYLKDFKMRFVDDPSGALADARRVVGRALESLGYPPPERANEASKTRQEVLREYQRTDTADSGNLEEMRDAFNRLSSLLERAAGA